MSPSLLPTILFASSEFDFHSPLSTFLSEHEFEVTLAQDSAQVLAKLESCYFDLALLDDNLPNLRQLDILETLHQHYPEIVVILLTEENETLENALLSLRYNIYDFLPKPFDPATLHKSIYAGLSERRFRILHRKTGPSHHDNSTPPHHTTNASAT